MANATKIIKDWCASCGMPEPSDGECHALTVALAAAPAADAVESVLIDGTAYEVPAPVACELLYLHMQLLETATQAADARDAAFEAVRKKFCKLQRYSFFLDDKGNVRRVPQFSGNWVEFESVHTLFDPTSVDAAIAAAKGE